MEVFVEQPLALPGSAKNHEFKEISEKISAWLFAILMQKFPGSVKLTCPENQCHIMRTLENWKHKDLGNQG